MAETPTIDNRDPTVDRHDTTDNRDSTIERNGTTDKQENTDSSYLSFANPNYCYQDQINSNLEAINNEKNAGDKLSLDKLSITDNHNTYEQISASSDYSSAEVTPSSPDRSFILRKLNSPTDEDDDDKTEDDVDDDVDDDDSSSTDCEDHVQYNLLSENNSKEDVREEKKYEVKKGRGILGYLTMLEAKAREREKYIDPPFSPDDGMGAPEDCGPTPSEGIPTPNGNRFEDETDINSPDSNDSGIQSDARSDDGVTHNRRPVKNDIYGVSKQPSKHGKTPDTPEVIDKDVAVPQELQDAVQVDVGQPDALPPGWQKHEDDDGAYYWHIKSGTIQRDPPPPAPPDGLSICSATVRSISLTSDSSASSVPSTPTSITSNTERHLQEFEGHALQYAAKSLQSLTYQPEVKAAHVEEDSGTETIRFAVRSLGWVRIAEEDLTSERSSKAVNKCIVDLSLGRNDINDAVGRWGDGKDLFMDIDSNSLRLLDPTDGTLLNSQPIHSIRVWGVGRDNGRDFAYVARDRMTRMHMCHVFQCDTPARQIANTLRDICKNIMQERNLHPPPPPIQRRPTDLPNLEKLGQTPGHGPTTSSLLNNGSFPTPMEEPRKILRCHYLGSHEVIRPTGMDVVNEAVDWMYYRVPPEKWTFVNVAIAPSTITITEHGNPDNILEECRVRFMSFMGISISNVKLCAFIMHTAQNKFMSHVFHCEPSAGPLCKTIEAACKLRYQKCLDAHPQTPKSAQNVKGVGAVLKASVKASVQGVQNILGLIKSKASSASNHS